MDIRKISVGPDYVSGAMHFLVGQDVLGGMYTIHLFKYLEDSESFRIWIVKGDEVVLWKEFNRVMPVSIEYNINF